MLTANEFHTLLTRHSSPLILDGALATELETRGHNLNHPLWSGLILSQSPSEIQSLHHDYFLSGAQITITASYQTTLPGLQQHLHLSEPASLSLIRKSAELAHNARTHYQRTLAHSEQSPPPLLVAGSIGPYGAYLANGSEYTGDYASTPSPFPSPSFSPSPTPDFATFHRPRIEALLSAHDENNNSVVDLLALETLPSYPEIAALLSLLSTSFSEAVAYLCVTLRDATHLSDGTPVSKVLELIEGLGETSNEGGKGYRGQIVAFGVNCCPLDLVVPFLRNVKDWYVGKGRECIPLVCYPNSGEVWDGEAKVWRGEKEAKGLRDMVKEFRDAGARIIGGCCRTGPGDIEAISRVLKES